jgi:hypothetical protein
MGSIHQGFGIVVKGGEGPFIQLSELRRAEHSTIRAERVHRAVFRHQPLHVEIGRPCT